MTKERHEKSLSRHSGEGRNPVISTNWTPACAYLEHSSDDQIARWNVEDTLNVDDRKRILDKLQRKFSARRIRNTA